MQPELRHRRRKVPQHVQSRNPRKKASMDPRSTVVSHSTAANLVVLELPTQDGPGAAEHVTQASAIHSE